MTAGTVQSTSWGNAKTITVVRRPERHKSRRFLIFLVVSEAIPHPLLGNLLEDRSYDLAVRFYAPPGVNVGFLDEADYVITGGLSKFHAAAQFLEQCRLVGCHEGVLFMDGDIRFDPAHLQAFLEHASSVGFSLAQPALSRDSSSYWKMTYHQPWFAWRETSFVEIMCPYLSRGALAKVLPTFTESISGYGLDFVWPKLLAGERIGIVDSFQMQHEAEVDLEGGPFYRYLATLGIDAIDEKASLRKAYNTARARPHSRRGAVVRPSGRLIVVPLFGPERLRLSQLSIDRWFAFCARMALFLAAFGISRTY